MIGYTDLAALTGPEGEAVRRLGARLDELWNAPASEQKARELTAILPEGQRLGIPQVSAAAGLDLALTLAEHQRPDEAMDAFVEVVAVLTRHRGLVSPEAVTETLRHAARLVGLMTAAPERPLSEVDDLLAALASVADSSEDSSLVHLARASCASWRGDAEATLAGLRTWMQTAESDAPTSESGQRTALALVDRVDLPLAIDLQRRWGRSGADAAGGPADDLALAARLSMAGDADAAASVVEGVLGRTDLRGAPAVDHAYWIRALEAHPDLVDPLIDDALLSVDLLRPSAYLVSAAIGRALLRRDPVSTRGLDLLIVAVSHAAVLDARLDTSANSQALRERWLTGLIARPQPRPADELTAVLEPRVMALVDRDLSTSEMPESLRRRILDIGRVAAAIPAMDSTAEAEAVARELIADDRRLHYPTAAVLAKLGLALCHLAIGSQRRAFGLWEEMQQVALERGGKVDPGVLASASAATLPIVHAQMAAPGVSLDEISATIRRQGEIAERFGLSRYDQAVAQAVVASYLGDAEAATVALQQAGSLPGGEDTLPGEQDLARILTMVRLDVTAAQRLLDAVAPEATAEGSATAPALAALRAYLLRRSGEHARAAIECDAALAGVTTLDEVAGPTLPYLVSAMDAWPRLEGLADAVEDWARDSLPGSWEVLAALAGVLSRRDPADQRGARLAEEASAHARALDARNATASASAQLRELWL